MTVMRPLRPRSVRHEVRLAAQIGARLGTGWQCLSMRREGWASATFAGARHHLVFAGSPAADRRGADRLARDIADLDFALRRAFVADAALTDRRDDAAGWCRLHIELLVIDDA
jgi:hypothetical protein